MRSVQQISDKMEYFKAQAGYVIALARLSRTPRVRAYYRMKRDLYARGYSICHEMLWGNRKSFTHIHFG